MLSDNQMLQANVTKVASAALVEKEQGVMIVPAETKGVSLPNIACGDAIEPVGPVRIVLNVFLASPYNLHGTIDLLGDFDGADRAVSLEPSAKAAADQMIVDDNFLRR